jgi:hypothetical protein
LADTVFVVVDDYDNSEVGDGVGVGVGDDAQ